MSDATLCALIRKRSALRWRLPRGSRQSANTPHMAGKAPLDGVSMRLPCRLGRREGDRLGVLDRDLLLDPGVRGGESA
eukprot:4486716-Prymnesium_polylepis.1